MVTPAEAFSKLWHSLVDNRRTGCPDISLFDLKCAMALTLAEMDDSGKSLDERLILGYVSLEPTRLDGAIGLLESGELKENRPVNPDFKDFSTPAGQSDWLAYHDAVSEWEDQIFNRTQEILNKLVSEGALSVDPKGVYTGG